MDRHALADRLASILQAHYAVLQVAPACLPRLTEQAAFMYIVELYRLQGWSPSLRNLRRGMFVLPGSPAADPWNFSYVCLTRSDPEGWLEVRGNLAVLPLGALQPIRPDVAVVHGGQVPTVGEAPLLRAEPQKPFALPNEMLLVFVEAKAAAVHPALVWSFVGLVLALCPECITESEKHSRRGSILAASGGAASSLSVLENDLKKRSYKVAIIPEIGESLLSLLSP